MNEQHLRLCASAEWADLVRDELLPWVLGPDGDLGDDVLEVGAGPGLVTDELVRLAPRLTAVEIDPALADALRERLAGRVEVVTADATALPLPADRFSAVACFTMLHHVPEVGLQDRVLAELRRVLRPGGLVLGTDGEDTAGRRELHVGDVFVPIDPTTLADRLLAAGFVEPLVESTGDRFRFRALAT